MLHSVRSRLTLWYTAVVAVVLIVFSSISYALLAREIRMTTDGALASTVREFAAAIKREPLNASPASVVQLDYRYSDRDLAVYTTGGALIASSHVQLTNDDLQRLAAAIRGGARGFTTISGGPENDGIRIFAMPATIVGQRYVIAAARTLSEQSDRLESAAQAVLLGIPLALLLAAVGGYLLARKALHPVATMSRRAREIGAATLTDRLPIENDRDELGFLAMTLNELLERLQRSFESQRHFMADASHELRTPVSIIQGEADVTLARSGRSEDEYRESLQIVQKTSLKLTRIVENLFLLARTDAGAYPMRKSRFYLDETIAECVRSMRNIMVSRGVRLECSVQEGMLITADEELVYRMLLNPVENAVKFTPEGGVVTVSATAIESQYIIRIRDTGLGIPAEQQSRIFERFYRVPRSGKPGAPQNPGGAGLGLPIARLIAEAHGGSLQLEASSSSGSTFTVVLPIIADDLGASEA